MFKNLKEYHNSKEMALKRALNRQRYNWDICENNEGQTVSKNNADTEKFIKGIIHNPEYSEYIIKNGYVILAQSLTNKELYDAIITNYPQETLKEININNVDIVEVRRCILKICNEEMRDIFMDLQLRLSRENNGNDDSTKPTSKNKTTEISREEQRRERRRQIFKQRRQEQKVLKKVLNDKKYDWNLSENIQGQEIIKDNEDTKKFINGLLNDSPRYTNRLINRGFVILAQSMTYKELYNALKPRYNQKILKEVNIDNVDFVEVRRCILKICNERRRHRITNRNSEQRNTTLREFALNSMARQRLPESYKNDDIMQINMVLRVPMNAKNWNWKDYRNINDDPLKQRFNEDTKKYFSLIHNYENEKIVEKYGYLYLLWANTYRELHETLVNELKLSNNDLKDIEIESVNMKEICRSILISVNEEMRYAIHWSQMGNR